MTVPRRAEAGLSDPTGILDAMDGSLALNLGVGLLFAVSVATFVDTLLNRRSWSEDRKKAGLLTGEEVGPEQGLTEKEERQARRFTVKWTAKMTLAIIAMIVTGMVLNTLPGFLEVYMIVAVILFGGALGRLYGRRSNA